MNSRENVVVVLKKNIFGYPSFPFNPPEKYLELKSLPYKVETDSRNRIYEAVRQMFFMYGLDHDNYGTEKWNPLSEIIKEGNIVVIKPNLVFHEHPLGKSAALSTVTHASIIRPIIDYCLLALKKRGEIIIADAPLQSADFIEICKLNGLFDLFRFYQKKLKNVKIKISLMDLRNKMLLRYANGVFSRYVKLKGDPKGYVIIDLGKDSFHREIDKFWKKYAVTGYDLDNLRRYHTNKIHSYFIARSILDADVIISCPKLKTHKKAGITVALKNFVGVNASKDFLPHYRAGIIDVGGDEYPRSSNFSSHIMSTIFQVAILKNLLHLLFSFRFFKRNLIQTYKKHSGSNRVKISEGSWFGNDTLWRTILDLNIIMKYADKKGKLQSFPQRKFLFIVDGIIGQEGLGPMHGKPKKCGLLMLGSNPCAIDYVAAKIMGFEVKYLKQVIVPFEKRRRVRYPLVNFDLSEIRVISNIKRFKNIHILERKDSLAFSAPNGWKVLEKRCRLND